MYSHRRISESLLKKPKDLKHEAKKNQQQPKKNEPRDKKHCVSYKEKISLFETERTQTYAKSSLPTHACVQLFSLCLSPTDLMDLLSLAAIKLFNLVFQLTARTLPREGAGLMTDTLQWVF